MPTNNMPAFALSRTKREAQNEMFEQAGVSNEIRRPPHIPRKEMRKRLVESMVIPAMMRIQAQREAENPAKAPKIKTVCGADGVTREVKADAELVGLTPFSMAVMTAPEELIDMFLGKDNIRKNLYQCVLRKLEMEKRLLYTLIKQKQFQDHDIISTQKM